MTTAASAQVFARRLAVPLVVALLIACVPSSAGDSARPSGQSTFGGAASAASAEGNPSPLRDPGGPPVLIAAGDIAACDREQDSATARLVEGIPGTVVTLGDNAYENGSAQDYERCYAPTWGAFRERTRPAPGNHEYRSRDAGPYFDYFGPAAGTRGEGWHAFDLGGWRIYALNSNCSFVGRCDAGSPQLEWLTADLAREPRRCVLAYWHHPLFSSGSHGDSPWMRPIWQALYDAGADVVLSAHDHLYERFARQDPSGAPDPQRGIRQFTAGTGGESLYRFGSPEVNSEARDQDSFGVLRLDLREDGYAWEFLPVEGSTIADSGSDTCS